MRRNDEKCSGHKVVLKGCSKKFFSDPVFRILKENQTASQDNSFPLPLPDTLRIVVHMATYSFNSAITSTIVRVLNSDITRKSLSTGEIVCKVEASTVHLASRTEKGIKC
jgi:hypothetical protein